MDTAAEFSAALEPLATTDQREKYKRFFPEGHEEFIGVPMGKVFGLAKQSLTMPASEIELLMESDVHEARAGAMSVIDKQARSKKTPQEVRKELHDLYLRRHDRVNDWDLVDLAAPHGVGGYLYTYEQPRDELYDLARSKNIWERRTAIVATAQFMAHDELDDTYAIAEILVADPEDLIQKAVGGWVRHAGKRDQGRLLEFLDRHAAEMPRTMLTYSMEHLSADQKAHYRAL